MSLDLQPSQLVIAAPVLGAILTMLLRDRPRWAVAVVTMLSGLVGAGAAVLLLVEQLAGRAAATAPTIGSLDLGELSAPMQLRVTDIGVLVAVTTAVVACVVQAFARWYLDDDPHYRRFAATVSLFTGAMQLVVLSGDLLLTLVGWELMGWCSYLLIGHESYRRGARTAAQKAFLVTRIADVPLVLGFAVLVSQAHTTSLSGVLQVWQRDSALHSTALTVALVGVVIGVLGKSAQFPFQDWLPDAMEGPTPASALIHAATMVAAGTVLLSQLYPLFGASETARAVVVVLAGSSMVLAAFLAFAQNDLKRLLAWSTVSQVGLMLVALAAVRPTEGPDLAIAHLVGHAAFKALLFLTIGWLSVLVGGTIAQRMSGAVRKHFETRSALAIGLLALAGVPPLVGFVTKDFILDATMQNAVAGSAIGVVALILVALVTVLTAAYAMRAWLIAEHRTVFERREVVTAIDDSHTVQDVGIVELLRHAPQVDEHGNVPDPTDVVEDDDRPFAGARLGLGLLMVLSVFGGAVVLTPLLDIDWKHLDLLLTVAALLLMVAAAMGVRLMSLRTTYGDAAEKLPARWRHAAARGLGMDTVYRAVVVRPVEALADGVVALEGVLDRGVTGLARSAASLSDRGHGLHTRTPHSGMLAVVAGTLVVAVVGVLLW